MKQLSTNTRTYLRPEPAPKMPSGLQELMRGLAKDVLKNNPTDVYSFCFDHMKKLLEIREAQCCNKVKSPRKITLEEKIIKAQKKVRERAIVRQENYDKLLKEQVESSKLTSELLINDKTSVDESTIHQFIDKENAAEVTEKMLINMSSQNINEKHAQQEDFHVEEMKDNVCSQYTNETSKEIMEDNIEKVLANNDTCVKHGRNDSVNGNNVETQKHSDNNAVQIHLADNISKVINDKNNVNVINNSNNDSDNNYSLNPRLDESDINVIEDDINSLYSKDKIENILSATEIVEDINQKQMELLSMKSPVINESINIGKENEAKTRGTELLDTLLIPLENSDLDNTISDKSKETNESNEDVSDDLNITVDKICTEDVINVPSNDLDCQNLEDNLSNISQEKEQQKEITDEKVSNVTIDLSENKNIETLHVNIDSNYNNIITSKNIITNNDNVSDNSSLNDINSQREITNTIEIHDNIEKAHESDDSNNNDIIITSENILTNNDDFNDNSNLNDNSDTCNQHDIRNKIEITDNIEKKHVSDDSNDNYKVVTSENILTNNDGSNDNGSVIINSDACNQGDITNEIEINDNVEKVPVREDFNDNNKIVIRENNDDFNDNINLNVNSDTCNQRDITNEIEINDNIEKLHVSDQSNDNNRIVIRENNDDFNYNSSLNNKSDTCSQHNDNVNDNSSLNDINSQREITNTIHNNIEKAHESDDSNNNDKIITSENILTNNDDFNDNSNLNDNSDTCNQHDITNKIEITDNIEKKHVSDDSNDNYKVITSENILTNNDGSNDNGSVIINSDACNQGDITNEIEINDNVEKVPVREDFNDNNKIVIRENNDDFNDNINLNVNSDTCNQRDITNEIEINDNVKKAHINDDSIDNNKIVMRENILTNNNDLNDNSSHNGIELKTENKKDEECSTENDTESINDNIQNDYSTNSVNENTVSEQMDLETAAITIQKVFRTFMFKSRSSTLDDVINYEGSVDFPYLTNDNSEIENDEKVNADDYLINNGNKDRRSMGISRMDTVLQTVNEEKSLSLSTDDSSTLSSAATTIQAHVRGFLVRNKLNSNKTNSSSSFVNSDGPSVNSTDCENDVHRSKTVLNIHIVPEGENFDSRDESLGMSIDLPLDASPRTNNLHPLGYDKTEPRKQLKREDAIQSVSPPSNNSDKLSEDVESVKEVSLNSSETTSVLRNDELVLDNNIDENSSNNVSTPVMSTANDVLKAESEKTNIPENTTEPENDDKNLLHVSSDEMDVITPYINSNDSRNTPYSEASTKLLHSGEFHDIVLPTTVSRNDSSVVRGE